MAGADLVIITGSRLATNTGSRPSKLIIKSSKCARIIW